MKKHLLFLLAFCALVFVSCDKDKDEETTDPAVANLKLTADVTANTVKFTAAAENAHKYAWDFANGESGEGATAEASYKIAGTYWVKCTASGAASKLTDSIKVEVLEGDPSVYNDVAKLLCGFNSENGESSAVWYWGANKDKMLSGGPKTFFWDRADSAVYSLFDPIDQSWWNEAGPSAISYNDAYSFKLNQSFDYSCEYGEDGLSLNWAYANYRYSIASTMYSDEPTTSVPTTGSWEIEVHEFEKYASYDSIHNAPQTIVDGVGVDAAYFLKVKGGAWLMKENAVAEYQILRIDADTVFMRWEAGIPADFNVTPGEHTWIKPDWAEYSWLSPGEGEWEYGYLVKDESTPEGK